MKIKMPLILASVLLALSAPAFADDDQKIIAQAAKNIMTTAQALKAADETPVTVYGTIHKHIKDEMYQLQDQTGIIHVEIDHDLATPAQLLNPGIKVRVVGEVDTHRYKPTDIDVVEIEIL